MSEIFLVVVVLSLVCGYFLIAFACFLNKTKIEEMQEQINELMEENE